jgi:hypothetical protein
MILVSGTASDNTGVQRVEVRLDDGPWLAASGTNSWSFGINSSNCLNGPHSINARAADAAGNFSATSSVAVVFYNLPGEYLRRVSCGNAASAIDCSSNTWAADRAWSWGGFGYSGGTSGYMANSITGVCASAQSIYQRERYSTGSGGFLYLFDCPAGIYETTLLEAETYWSGPGQRVFNIFIQNQPARTNLDLCAAAGGNNRPLTLVFTNAVTNAQLQLWFQPLVDNARSSGIQVRKIAEVFSDTDGIPDWWRLGWFGHPLGDAADQSRADDDADRDGASNLTEYRSGTDPLSAASKPPAPQAAIQGVSLRGADVVVTCDATTNWSYQLQRRAEIGVAPWNDAGATAVASNGTATLTDLGGGTNPVGFYRVKVR